MNYILDVIFQIILFCLLLPVSFLYWYRATFRSIRKYKFLKYLKLISYTYIFISVLMFLLILVYSGGVGIIDLKPSAIISTTITIIFMIITFYLSFRQNNNVTNELFDQSIDILFLEKLEEQKILCLSAKLSTVGKDSLSEEVINFYNIKNGIYYFEKKTDILGRKYTQDQLEVNSRNRIIDYIGRQKSNF